MSALPDTTELLDQIDAETSTFYRHVLQTLSDDGVPFLVGGAFALACFTEIRRHTKDLDLFIRREDFERVSQALGRAGYLTELTYPHWLGKVHAGDAFVDLIFGSGNGAAPVDEAWFQHATEATVLGIAVKVSPPEESIWSKAFIMERERYDGADVAHLIHECAGCMDWQRLLARFGPHWRVLLSHLVLFGFVYPAERTRIPAWLMDELISRLRHETHAPAPRTDLCGGTLLSREQYLIDVEQQGYRDARVTPEGNMTPEDVAYWTSAIPGRQQEQTAPEEP
ncbi:MAG: nucleotidyltransferase [Pseudomonadota bacterium]